MAARKPSRAVVKSAHRINKAYDLLKEGKTPNQTVKKIKLQKSWFPSYLNILRGGFKGKPPIFIPPKGVHNWSLARAKKVVAFSDFSKEVIKGNKQGVKKNVRSLSKKSKAAIAELKKNPHRTNVEISKLTGMSIFAVWRHRKSLIEANKIPAVNRSELSKRYQRKDKKKTHIFSKKKRKALLKEKMHIIQNSVRKLYLDYKNIFDFDNMAKEKIVDEIAERLDWRLQIYNPKILQGSEQTKLNRFFSWHIKRIGIDILKTSFRRYQNIQSLEKVLSTSGDGKELTLKSGLKAKSESHKISVGFLEKISKKLKLDVMKEAVLFGLAAGFSNKVIASAIGLRPARVSRIKIELEKKTKKLLSK